MRQVGWIVGLVALVGCNKPADTDDSDPVDTDAALACDATVAPGADDQTAVQTALIEAGAGDVVCYAEGTYTFQSELSLAVDGVTMRGAGRAATIFSWAEAAIGGNGIAITGDGVTIEHLHVQDAPGDGIRATNVAGITFRDLDVTWTADATDENGAYGLYPIGSDQVVIQRVRVKGASDAGIYVGQSTNILVADSEVHGNVAGIEIENSTDAEVRGNHAHDNTAGILVFNLPGLPVYDGKRANVHHNVVENNNLPNFASEGTVVSGVPHGTGMMVLAADANEFHGNTVSNNITAAMLIVSYSSTLFGAYDDPDYDIYAQSNWVHGNTYSGNGTDPQGDLAAFVPMDPVPDIVWDGCEDKARENVDNALTNCVSDLGAATFYHLDLCGGFIDATTDPAEWTCEHTPLPVTE